MPWASATCGGTFTGKGEAAGWAFGEGAAWVFLLVVGIPLWWTFQRYPDEICMTVVWLVGLGIETHPLIFL